MVGEARQMGLSIRGLWLSGAGVVWILAGLMLARPILTLLGALLLVGIAVVFSLALFIREGIGRSVEVAARRSHISEDDDDAPVSLRMHVGQALALQIKFALPSQLSAAHLSLDPVTTESLLAVLNEDGDERELVFRSFRLGDAFLHGFTGRSTLFAGLVDVCFWVPFHRRVCIVPGRFRIRKNEPFAAARTSLRDRAASVYAARRGLGFEIRELRDYAPGDPFKHIAWRATARRGKLVSREFESDLDLSAVVAIDISSSMFWGVPGKTRVDYAINTAFGLCSSILDQGYRAGVLAFDQKVRLVVPVDSGKRQIMRITDNLLEVPHLLHEDRTEVTDRELMLRVARYLTAQEGIGFELVASPGPSEELGDSSLDIARLLSVSRSKLAQLLEARGSKPPLVPVDAYSGDAHQSILRALARYAGIPIPQDPTPVPNGQALGLAAAMRRILKSRGGPHTIVIISDLYSADDVAQFARLAMTARKRCHQIVIVCPSHRAFEPDDDVDVSPLSDAVGTAVRWQSENNLKQLQMILKLSGVSFLHCGPEDVVPRLMRRLRLIA